MPKITHCPHCSKELFPIKMFAKVCQRCSKEFSTRWPTAKFCSRKCYKNNPDRAEWRRQKHRKWYQRKKETDPAYIEKCRERARKRIKTPIDRIKMSLRSRVRRLIKYRFKMPTKNKLKLIGCSPEFLKTYLESKFYGGMTWENYAKLWVVDHAVPISKFDLSKHEERELCCHFSNLQPLLYEHNAEKSARVDWIKPV